MVVLSLFGSGIIMQPAKAAVSATLDIWCMGTGLFDDTYVNEWAPNENYVNSITHEVGYRFQGDTHEFSGHEAALLYFNIESLPDDADILEASLVLYKTGGNHDAQLYRVMDAWDGSTVTWNNRPDLWDTQVITWDVPSTNGFVEVDVTTWVDSLWFDEVSVNRGIWIQNHPYDTMNDNYLRFRSYEGAAAVNGTQAPHLHISYTTETPVEQPDPPQPPPWVDDHSAPTVEMTVSPAVDVSPSDTVHFVLDAHDDTCLFRIKLYLNGILTETVTVLPPDEDVTSLSLYYNSTMALGDVQAMAVAEDQNGNINSTRASFHVGTDTPPQVTISTSVDWVFPNDGQNFTVTATVDDPEGIRSLVVGAGGGHMEAYQPDFGNTFEYSAPYPTHVVETITVTNDQIPMPSLNPLVDALNASEIVCQAQAQDAEGIYSSSVRTEIECIRPYQWDYGLPFANSAAGDLGWGRMSDTFGRAELRGPGSQDWWWTVVARFWKPIYDLMGSAGQCYGFSAYSLWHHHYGEEVPDDLVLGGLEDIPVDPSGDENTYNQRAIERYQGSQISQEILSQFVDQIGQELDDEDTRAFYGNEFQDLVRDVRADNPGVLYIAQYRGTEDGIMECIGAHAVVPWFVQEVAEDEWRVYVYDSNRDHASDHFDTDYDNFEHYPYVTVREDSWSYNFEYINETVGYEVWDQYIWYLPYERTSYSDYDLMDGWLVAGTIVLSIVIIGTVLALLPVLLSIPIPIPMADHGGHGGIQAAAYPADEEVELRINSTGDEGYSWLMMGGHSCYGILNKSAAGEGDRLLVDPEGDHHGWALRLNETSADGDFIMGMQHLIGNDNRSYMLEDISLNSGGDLEVCAVDEGDGLRIRNYGPGSISCRVVLAADGSNSTGQADLVLAAGEQALVSADWGDLEGSLTVQKGDIPQGPSAPKDDTLTYVIIALLIVAAAAVAAFFLLRKGRRG
jgi:hypothetical protein